VSGAPNGVNVKYYLNNTLLNTNEITLTNAGTYTIYAKIENDNVYNDVSASYTITYVKNKRTASLSFANATVNETVEDVTEYSGTV